MTDVSTTAAAGGEAKTKDPPSSTLNNNSLPKEVSMEELELLKKLEAANR